jgi:hypothetical protein
MSASPRGWTLYAENLSGRNIVGATGVSSTMSKRQLAKSVPFIIFFAVVASAADISGSWKADLQTPQGTVQVSYFFKLDGDKLTGTWQAAKSPTIQISDGKVTGDKISFVVKVDANGAMTFAHEGKINGDEIQLTMKPSGEFPGSTLVAKRVN